MNNRMNVHSATWILPGLGVLLGIGCVNAASDPATETEVSPLTCAMITGPSCWTAALSDVAGCAPGRAVSGQLSSNAMSCTYPSGTAVTFTRNVTTLGLRDGFGFDLATNGALCVGFTAEQGNTKVRTLRTATGETSWTLDDNVRLSCPDGAVYETDLASALACDGFPSALGFITVSGTDIFEFSLLSEPHNIDVLSCTM